MNSASLFDYDDVVRFSAAHLDQHMRINLTAPVMLLRALHARTKDGAHAFAINLLDQKVFNPNPDYLSYTFSKIALAGALDLLAQTFAPRVRVNAIAPGLLLPSGTQTEEDFRKVHGGTALGKGARPEDVADAAAFLAQAERPYRRNDQHRRRPALRALTAGRDVFLSQGTAQLTPSYPQ